MQNWIGIAASLVYIFTVIFLARFMTRFGKEASRKTVHILVCNWWFLAMYFCPAPVGGHRPGHVRCDQLLVLPLPDFPGHGARRREGGPGHRLLCNLPSDPLSPDLWCRQKPLGRSSGDPDHGVWRWPGSGDRQSLFPGVPTTCFGSSKSLTGNLTMFVVSFAVLALLITWQGSASVFPAALGLALLATLVETMTPLGLDNLTVPLVSALAYGMVIT